MKTFSKLFCAFLLLVVDTAALQAAPFTYSVTNNTYQGVDIALYESNAPGNYTFQNFQLLGTNTAIVLTNSTPQATNGIAVLYTNQNSFSGIATLTKLPPLIALDANGCYLTADLTNSFTRFTIGDLNGLAPQTNFTGSGASGAAPQTINLGTFIGDGSALSNVNAVAAQYVTGPYRALYVSTNGNDATAQFNNPKAPWRQLFDITNGVTYGAFACATNPGDTVILLTDNQTPIIPFKQEGTTLNMNGHTLLRVTNTLSGTIWPINGFGAQPFDFPMVMMQDNCTLENGTLLYTNPPYGSVAGGSSVVFGMSFPSGKIPNYGTNLYQWLNWPQNSCVATNFGIWTQWGVTNLGATNFTCNNVFFNMVGYDVAYINDYPFDDVQATNGTGDYWPQPYKPSQMTFNNCSAFGMWDIWIIEGDGVICTFNNMDVTRYVNYLGGEHTAVYCSGQRSILNVNGGWVNDYAQSSTNELEACLAGARIAVVTDDPNPIPVNGVINLNGPVMLSEASANNRPLDNGGNSIEASAVYNGWFVWTNGLAQFVGDSAANVLTTSTAGVTNTSFNNVQMYLYKGAGVYYTNFADGYVMSLGNTTNVSWTLKPNTALIGSGIQASNEGL